MSSVASETDRVFLAHILNPLALDNVQLIERGAIGVLRDGKVAFVGKADEMRATHAEFFAAATIVDCGERVILPGFVDTHCHGPQYHNAGTGTDLPLLEWLERYTFPTEARFANVDFATKVYNRVVRATIRNGTTTCCYFATIHAPATIAFAEIVANAGQRALVGKVCMDRNSPDTYVEKTQDSLRDAAAVVEHINNMKNNRIEPVITPRFVPTCSSELMNGLGALAKESNSFIQSHVSENRAEIEWVKKLHPDLTSYTDVYRAHGLLTRRTILAHAVHLTDDELTMFRESGASVAHCPNSNFTLQSGVFDVRRVIAAKVKIGLGTDMSGGYATSMWDAIRLAIVASTVHACEDHALPVEQRRTPLSYKEAVFLATQGGAEALDMGDKVGSFVKGKQFDAIMLDAYVADGPIDMFDQQSVDEMVQKLIFCADDRSIQRVFVGGRLIGGREFQQQ